MEDISCSLAGFSYLMFDIRCFFLLPEFLRVDPPINGFDSKSGISVENVATDKINGDQGNVQPTIVL